MFVAFFASVVIGRFNMAWSVSGFTSDRMRKWRENCKPITKRSNEKPKQMRVTFDTQQNASKKLSKKTGKNTLQI